jgi:hypothetical protein
MEREAYLAEMDFQPASSRAAANKNSPAADKAGTVTTPRFRFA